MDARRVRFSRVSTTVVLARVIAARPRAFEVADLRSTEFLRAIIIPLLRAFPAVD
jgi:hypothetical protein